MDETIPAGYEDLLDRPLVGDLGTIRPDGSVQLNPMWFRRDGDTVRFTHTTTRAKYRNLLANPAMTLLVVDPDDPGRYLELRGTLDHVEPDPSGTEAVRLRNRYGNPDTTPPPDAADRVVLVLRWHRALGH